MRGYLLGAASIFVLCTGIAQAQEFIEITEATDIAEDQEGQTSTSTANDDGSASDISISTGGRVFLAVDDYASSPALLIDSDNSVYLASGGSIELESTDADGEDVTTSGGIGVQIAPGVVADFESQGSIVLEDAYVGEDLGTDLVDLDGDGEEEADGDVDGAFALDVGKTGFLIGEVDDNNEAVIDQAGVQSNVYLVNSSIRVEGQDSYGIRVVTDVTGDLYLDGTVSMVGERSTGVSIESDVSGDLQIGSINTDSPEGQALLVDGEVGGGLRIVGLINSTGYRYTTRLSETNEVVIDEGDDDLNAATGSVISGSVDGGLFVNSGGSIVLVGGEGAGLEIGKSGEVLTMGEITLPDDFGITDEEEFDEDEDGDALGYSLVNRGGITASGVHDGRNATGVLIGGLDEDGVERAVIFEAGGILNEGAISSTTYDAVARSLVLGAGTQAASLHNQGTISSTNILGYSEDDRNDESYNEGESFAVIIEGDADIGEIFNDQSTILALVSGGGSKATAILIDGNSVQTLVNTGAITANAILLNEDLYGSGTTAEESGIDLIAVDASAMTNGLEIRQELGEDRDLDGDDEADEADDPSMFGDVLFGSGDDVLDISAGTFNGDVSFGDGADQLLVSGGEVNAGVSDSDGQLDISVESGTLAIAPEETLSFSNLDVTNEGQLDVFVADTLDGSTVLNASGTVSIDETSTLSIGLSTLVGDNFEVVLIDAGSLDLADGVIESGDAPYLYNSEISVSSDDPNALVLTLTRKSSEELALEGGRLSSFDQIVTLLDSTEDLGSAFASLRSESDFLLAYDQLLPEYASSAIQIALAANDAASGALSTRLTNARLAPDQFAGVWVEEFAYYADRTGTSLASGYRGEGIGLATGFDMPWGPFYAVGFSVMGAASQTEEVSGFDNPMISMTGQLGAYAGWETAGLDFSVFGGLGIDSFETERNVVIDSFSAIYNAEWTGWHSTASFKAGRDVYMGNWLVRPEANLTYLGLWEEGFSETADTTTSDNGNAGLALTIDERESSALVGSALISVGRRFGNEVSWWAPTFRVGYRGEFLDETADTSAYFGDSNDAFTLQSESLPGSGVMLGFGLDAGSNYSTFSFAYDADIRDDFVRHVARLMIRLTF